MPKHAALPNVPGVPGADEIQKALDQLFVKYPELAQYIEWLKYVPQGGDLPEGTTHTLKLANLKGDDFVIATKAEGIWGFVADKLLAVL